MTDLDVREAIDHALSGALAVATSLPETAQNGQSGTCQPTNGTGNSGVFVER